MYEILMKGKFADDSNKRNSFRPNCTRNYKRKGFYKELLLQELVVHTNSVNILHTFRRNTFFLPSSIQIGIFLNQELNSEQKLVFVSRNYVGLLKQTCQKKFWQHFCGLPPIKINEIQFSVTFLIWPALYLSFREI